MMKLELTIGVLAKDKVSGLKGVVNSKAELMCGSIQYSIQPEGKGKDIPESHYFDAHQIEVLGAGLSKTLPPVDPTVTIVLGEEVVDLASDFKGIAIEKVTHLNGCVYFEVISKFTPKMGEKGVLRLTLVHKRLKRVGAGLSKKAAEASPEVEPKKVPGGPSRRYVHLR